MPGTITTYRYRVAGTNDIVTTTAPIQRILSPAAMWDTGASDEQCRELVWDPGSRSYVFPDGGIVPHGPMIACPAGTRRLIYDGTGEAQAGAGSTDRGARRVGEIARMPLPPAQGNVPRYAGGGVDRSQAASLAAVVATDAAAQRCSQLVRAVLSALPPERQAQARDDYFGHDLKGCALILKTMPQWFVQSSPGHYTTDQEWLAMNVPGSTYPTVQAAADAAAACVLRGELRAWPGSVVSASVPAGVATQAPPSQGATIVADARGRITSPRLSSRMGFCAACSRYHEAPKTACPDCGKIHD